MNLASLSTEELSRSLQSLQGRTEEASARNQLDDVVQELQVHRIELEMQNRALREMQTVLEHSVQRYADLYDHLPVGYVTLSSSGQILQANLTAARWLRRDRAKLTGTYINWFLNAFDAGKFSAHLDECVRSGGEQKCEVTLRLEDGLAMTVQLTSRLADVGTRDQVHTAITDVSMLTQARLMLADGEREKALLASLCSAERHDPDAVVSGFSRTLLTEHRKDLPPEVLFIVERMDRAAVRMEAMLQHMIDFCCLGEPGRALDPVNLEEVVQQVIMEQRTEIAKRGALVEVARPLPCVRGSRLVVAQLLANLLANALKSPEEGRSLRINIASEDQADAIVLKISDDGFRLPQDGQSFRVFERLHGARHFMADGVGFCLMRRALETMNGRVWVDYGPDGVRCFHLGLQRV